MDKIYFLVVIGVLALALMFLTIKIDKKRKLEANKKKQKSQLKAQLYHRHLPTVHHGLPSRTTSLPPRHVGAFDARNQRAGEESRKGSAITANRLFSDEEIPQVEETHGLTMHAIAYTPENAPKTSQTRR